MYLIKEGVEIKMKMHIINHDQLFIKKHQSVEKIRHRPTMPETNTQTTCENTQITDK